MNFRTLDLNLLRVFDAVMAERNLSRAAEQLAMTQPAVSNALRRLREHLGEPLFARAAHGVRPTPRAEALWPPVQAALQGLQHELEPQHFNPRTHAQRFQLAMADATASLLLPPLMQALQAQEAALTLSVLPLSTRDPRPDLEQGRAHLAVGHFPEVMAQLESADTPLWHHAELARSDYVCVMRRHHPLAQQELTLDAYCQAQHLLVSFSGRGRGWVDDALAAQGRSRRLVLTVNQFHTAGRVVACTDLLTVLPTRFFEVTGEREGLVARPLPVALAPLVVHLMWHHRHHRQPGHRWLREQLQGLSLDTATAPKNVAV